MNWKSRIRKLTRWRTKNERKTDEERRRTTENLHGFAHGNVSEALREHLGSDFLHGNNYFHPKQLKRLGTTLFCLFIGKMGRRLPPTSPRQAQLTQVSCVASSRSNPALKILRKTQVQNFKNCYLHPPILISSPPIICNLQKSYGSLMEAYRTWFYSFFLFLLTHIKWNMLF